MAEYKFDAKKTKDELVEWLREYYDNNGNPLNAVIGVSGGKDSNVVLAALVEAIGTDRVCGILMPNGTQADIADSYKICEHVGIKPYLVNIKNGYDGILNSVAEKFEPTNQMKINLAPVMRMSVLKSISQCVNGRFTCNGNLSELYLGWYTLNADNLGDIRPLANLTVTEVIAVGKELGLPDWAIYKKPADGLCGTSDEMQMGISYSKLDVYIRTGEIDDFEMKERIDARHKNNLFKLEPMPSFMPSCLM